MEDNSSCAGTERDGGAVSDSFFEGGKMGNVGIPVRRVRRRIQGNDLGQRVGNTFW